jgi:hypothetical protein
MEDERRQGKQTGSNDQNDDFRNFLISVKYSHQDCSPVLLSDDTAHQSISFQKSYKKKMKLYQPDGRAKRSRWPAHCSLVDIAMPFSKGDIVEFASPLVDLVNSYLNKQDRMDQLFCVIYPVCEKFEIFRNFTIKQSIYVWVSDFLTIELPNSLNGSSFLQAYCYQKLNLTHLLRILIDVMNLHSSMKNDNFVLLICLSNSHPDSIARCCRLCFPRNMFQKFQSFLVMNQSSFTMIRTITLLFYVVSEVAVNLALSLLFKAGVRQANDVD